MQAIGSVAAIVFAVLIGWLQQKMHRRHVRETAESAANALLRSLLDELTVVSHRFRTANGASLLAGSPGEAFSFTIPMVPQPFPVYASLIGRIGEIADDQLRKLTIIGYSHGYGFVESIGLNNRMIDAFETADYLSKVHDDPVHHWLRESRLNRLQQYGDTLRESYPKAVTALEELIAALEKAVSPQQVGRD